MDPEPQWVMDTTAYSHLCQAGHSALIPQLAPGGVVAVPTAVDNEIERGRDKHAGILSSSTVPWASVIVPTDEEDWTALQVKAQLGGGPEEHLGECYVIACAFCRGLTAILDDEAAVAQADRLGVPSHGTMWLVVEAYVSILGRDRDAAARIIDDLLQTGMWLPVKSGESLFSWAYENGLLP